jgi:molybdate transport repressor ModE-like protein
MAAFLSDLGVQTAGYVLRHPQRKLSISYSDNRWLSMKLHHFRHLVALADAGSIRAAARTLGLSQPAVTKSIGQLEKELNVSLVSRSTHGTTLTRHGKAIVPRARAIANEVRRTREDIAQLVGSGQGDIAIGASALASLVLLPPALRQLREKYPKARVYVVDGLFPTVTAPLREGAINLYVGPLPPQRQRKQFRFQELAACALQVVARRDNPHRPKIASLADLVERDWIVSGPADGYGATVEQAFAEHGLPKPNLATQIDSIMAVLSVLSATDQFAMLPRQLYEGWPQLAAVPVKEPLRPVRIGIITAADVPLSPIAAEFARLVRRHAAYLSE